MLLLRVTRENGVLLLPGNLAENGPPQGRSFPAGPPASACAGGGGRTPSPAPKSLIRAWLLLAWVLLFYGSAAHADPYRLGLGVYSSQKPKDAAAHFLPFTKALQAALSSRVKQPVEVYLSIMRTYEDGERFLQDGDVDFLELGAANYVLAKRKNPDLELLAVRSPSDAKQLAGVICVRGDSTITSIHQLKGKAFAFGDKRSTTGHFLSQQHIFDSGILARDLSKHAHLANHREVAAAVAAGKFDAGAVNMVEFQQAVRGGLSLRILSRFPNFGRPWVCRSRLPAELKQALKQSLLELADVPSLGVMDSPDTTILPADESYFESLREAIENEGLFHGRPSAHAPQPQSPYQPAAQP